MWWLEETVENFKGFNITELGTDEAWLNISSYFKEPLWLYILSANCHTCSFRKFMDEQIHPNHSYKAVVNVQHGLTFRLRTSGEFNYTPNANDRWRICDVQSKLGEFGVYNLHIDAIEQKLVHCSLKTELEPVNTYTPSEFFFIEAIPAGIPPPSKILPPNFCQKCRFLAILVTLLFWISLGFIGKYVYKLWNWMAFTTTELCTERLSSFIRNRNEDQALLTSTRNSNNQEPDPNEINAKNLSTTAKKVTRKHKKRKATNSQSNDEEPLPQNSSTNMPSTSASSTVVAQRQSTPPSSTIKERLKSLDAFRGLCIVLMILADDGGGGYYFLQHCTWDGLYVADLAFPWFLWICGASIPFSINSRLSSRTSKMTVFKETIIRSLKLIFMGIMVNTSTRATAVQLENLRLPGVLQRFGICYFVGTALFLMFYHPETNSTNEPQSNEQEHLSWRRYFKDFKSTGIAWCFVIIMVGLHATIIFCLPVPHCPSGYLGPGGLHNDSALPPDCVGGASGFIDRLIFGIDHIHNRPTSKGVYGSGPFDPEGVLGILTSILQIWLGVQSGAIMLAYNNATSRGVRLLVWSVVCGIGGFILCGGISNSGWIPINKNLWSLSFVLVTSSSSLILLTIMFLVIDVQQMWSGSPLVETGRNSILLYLAHEVCHAMVPWHFSYGRMILHTSKLMESFWGIVLWILIAVYLHERKLFFVV